MQKPARYCWKPTGMVLNNDIGDYISYNFQRTTRYCWSPTGMFACEDGDFVLYYENPDNSQIYVASRVKQAPLWLELKEKGIPIISSWIHETGENETEDFGELWSRIRNEVRLCKALVLYVEPEDFPLKGALIETGMALAFNKPVIVCLPGVVLDGRTNRPIGSWIGSPLVTRIDNIDDAIKEALR